MSERTDVTLPEEAVRQDLAEIYIGNLNTVDTDLKLPSRGKRGARFHWKSHETLFISHDGKVTRPTYGVGNRKIVLTASSAYEGGSATRTFEATVLEEPRQTTIISLRPVKKTVALGEAADLPPVVIATDDRGIQTTLPVKWESFELPQAAGVISVKGHAEETELVAEAEITVAGAAAEGTASVGTAAAEFTTAEMAAELHTVCEIPVYQVPAGSVRLEEGTRFRDAEERMMEWLLVVNNDQMLYNFRAAAGLDVKGADPMTGWDAPECNLKGHTTGHYLSGLALAWSVSRRWELKEKIDYMIQSLSECQKALEKKGCARGFLSAYSEEQFDLLEVYTRYPKIWAPYYTLDKIMSGLYDCYRLAGNREAFTILTGMGDWVYNRLSRLSREQLDRMWSMYIAGEFGGMISVMVRLYNETKDEKYIKAATFFRNEKLFYPMEENVDTLKDMHANQHIPQIIGALELYKAGGGSQYLAIAKNFWQMVVRSHEYCIGGVGETEMFHEPGDIAHYMTDKSAESCASYNLMRLTMGLFGLKPDSRRMDYYENVLYNHILSSASHREDGGTTYFMPVRPGGRKEFSTTENTCCHGTGLESRFRYIRDIYAVARDGKEIYVNLYIPSTLDMEGGWKLRLETGGQVERWGSGEDSGWGSGQGSDQGNGQGSGKENGRSSRQLSAHRCGAFRITYEGDESAEERTIALRIPYWTEDDWKIQVSGTGDADLSRSAQKTAAVDNTVSDHAIPDNTVPDADGYVRIKRQWKKGDCIQVCLACRFRKLPAPDGSGYTSIAYGPYILAALNDREEYLTCPDVERWNREEDLAEKMEHGLAFETDGMKWMPLADVEEERYHIYFVDKES